MRAVCGAKDKTGHVQHVCGAPAPHDGDHICGGFAPEGVCRHQWPKQKNGRGGDGG